MNKEIKGLWVAALKDGTREQGHGYLRDKAGRQCCLDVLCELAVEAGVIEPPELTHIGLGDDANPAMVYRYSETGGTTIHYLPWIVVDWAELNGDGATNPYVIWKGNRTPLSELNDIHYCSFEEIADAIEESL